MQTWVLILFVFGYGDAIVPVITTTEFSDRGLCVVAKNYYESESFKNRILSNINRDTLRLDAQCFQKEYSKK